MYVPSAGAQTKLRYSAGPHPSYGGQQRGPSVSGDRTPSSEEEPAKGDSTKVTFLRLY